MLISIPGYVIGIVGLILFAYIILKIVFKAGTSAAEAVENAAQKSQHKKDILSERSETSKKFDELSEQIYTTSSPERELMLESGEKLNRLKLGLENYFDIEIYDDKLLTGKTLKELKQLVEAQIIKYQEYKAT